MIDNAQRKLSFGVPVPSSYFRPKLGWVEERDHGNTLRVYMLTWACGLFQEYFYIFVLVWSVKVVDKTHFKLQILMLCWKRNTLLPFTNVVLIIYCPYYYVRNGLELEIWQLDFISFLNLKSNFSHLSSSFKLLPVGPLCLRFLTSSHKTSRLQTLVTVSMLNLFGLS